MTISFSATTQSITSGLHNLAGQISNAFGFNESAAPAPRVATAPHAQNMRTPLARMENKDPLYEIDDQNSNFPERHPIAFALNNHKRSPSGATGCVRTLTTGDPEEPEYVTHKKSTRESVNSIANWKRDEGLLSIPEKNLQSHPWLKNILCIPSEYYDDETDSNITCQTMPTGEVDLATLLDNVQGEENSDKLLIARLCSKTAALVDSLRSAAMKHGDVKLENIMLFLDKDDQADATKPISDRLIPRLKFIDLDCMVVNSDTTNKRDKFGTRQAPDKKLGALNMPNRRQHQQDLFSVGIRFLEKICDVPHNKPHAALDNFHEKLVAKYAANQGCAPDEMLEILTDSFRAHGQAETQNMIQEQIGQHPAWPIIAALMNPDPTAREPQQVHGQPEKLQIGGIDIPRGEDVGRLDNDEYQAVFDVCTTKNHDSILGYISQKLNNVVNSMSALYHEPAYA